MTVEMIIAWSVVMLLAVVAASVIAYYAVRRPTAGHLRARLERDLPDLQAEFFEAAVAAGKPHGLRWLSCRWEGETTLAEDVANEETVALVAVVLHLEPEGGGPVEAHTGSAVFYYEAGRWQTDGKVILDHRPREVPALYADQYDSLSIG